MKSVKVPPVSTPITKGAGLVTPEPPLRILPHRE